MLHRNCMRQATPHVISRFENKAANTHEGGDLSENCQLMSQYVHVLRVFHLRCHINKYDKYISRLI